MVISKGVKKNFLFWQKAFKNILVNKFAVP